MSTAVRCPNCAGACVVDSGDVPDCYDEVVCPTCAGEGWIPCPDCGGVGFMLVAATPNGWCFDQRLAEMVPCATCTKGE